MLCADANFAVVVVEKLEVLVYVHRPPHQSQVKGSQQPHVPNSEESARSPGKANPVVGGLGSATRAGQNFEARGKEGR